jgi:AAA domain/Bifunctional DNA primase/polymerase, N-terminal/Primase C terminal 2 (PriCT-2)
MNLPIFPCNPTNKRPYTARGFYDATTDEKQIAKWKREHPDVMWGVPTGEKSGWIVIDLDRKEGGADGVATWEKLVAENGGPPQTRTHVTPSTGMHLIFKYRAGIRCIPLDKLWPGIEIKGDGGYVINAPGRMADGREYTVKCDVEPAELPDWVQARIDEYYFEQELNRDAGKGIVWENDNDFLPTPIEKIEFALTTYTPNTRAIWLETAAGLYKKLGDAGWPLFLNWSRNYPSNFKGDNDCRKMWKEAAKFRAFRINTVFHYADEADPTWRERYEAQQGGKPEAWDDGGQQEEAKQQQKTPIHATPYVWKDPKSIPRRQWLFKPSYIRQFTSMLVATSKVGKSSLLVGETLSMVSHKALLGVMPAAPLRVWYWNGEDPQEEIERHFAAAISHYKLTPADISDRLFVDSGRVMPIIIAEMGKYGTQIAIPTVRGVIEALRANKIDALVIDPFVSSHRVGENDNVAIERVAKMWTYIAEVTNCAIRYAHHSRKTGGEPVTGESQRGASANYAAVRCADTLNYMSQQEAENAGIKPHRRKFYFRQDDESNLLPPADDTKWYEKISVDLCNAPTPEDSDKVGVVVPWHYPTTQEVNATLVERDAILNAIRKKEWWQENSQAKDWIGIPISGIMKIDIKNKLGRQQVRKIIAEFLELQLLRRERRGIRGRSVPCLTAGPKPLI